jgi:hypothetical protein
MSDVSLKDYIESRLTQERELRETQVRDRNSALEAAKVEVDRRLEEMNNLRAQISSERQQFLSREVFDRAHGPLEDRVRILENFKANIDGRFLAMAGLLIFIQVALAAIALFWLKK